jgi:tetratricopeptide (TPR) repeat protein
MKRLGWFVSVVLIWSELFAAPATADDRDACNKGSAAGDAAIAACTRLIASGTLKGANLRRGLAYDSQGDLDHAIADYCEAIRLNRKFAIAFADRGGAYKAKGDLDHAIADYSEALQLDPKNTFALNGRGDAHYAKGDLDPAIADYSEAIRLDPTLAVAFYNRGGAHYAKGDLVPRHSDYDWLILSQSRMGKSSGGTRIWMLLATPG